MIIETILALSVLAQAQLFSESPEDTAASVKGSIAGIQAAMHLSDFEYKLAVAAAAAFVYVGPCEGTQFPNDEAFAAIQLISLADPSVPYQAAALEIVGLFLRSNLGRPTAPLCALALEMAKIPK